MYKRQMTKDLRKIFGVKKVIFGDVADGLEQYAIYADIQSVKQTFSQGKIRFSIRGRLGLLGSKEGNLNGFLRDRLFQAYKKEDTREAAERFLLYGQEEIVKYDYLQQFIEQSQQNFYYKVKVEYDPPKLTKFFQFIFKGWLK